MFITNNICHFSRARFSDALANTNDKRFFSCFHLTSRCSSASSILKAYSTEILRNRVLFTAEKRLFTTSKVLFQKKKTEVIVISKEERQKRLDAILSKHFPNHSHTQLRNLIKAELVLLRGKAVTRSTLVEEGDKVEITFSKNPKDYLKSESIPERSLESAPIPLNILYEDEVLVAVNKPAGVLVHASTKDQSGTIFHALHHHCSQLQGSNTIRLGLAHRLDKDTSGVLVAAKTKLAYQKLVESFSNRLVHKEYLAICVGNPGNQIITGNIEETSFQIKKMALVKKKGKEAITHCESIGWNKALSIVRLYPKTGRTHQLRVHLESIGHPILGDRMYGNIKLNMEYGADRQLLHAESIRFPHPLSQKDIFIQAPIPDDLASFMTKIKKNNLQL